MSARRLLGVATVLAVLVAAGCGGSSTGGTGGTSGVKEGGIFTEGTTNYIDTLNPFNYIEAQSVTAYQEVYPTLIQYGPGLKDIVPSYAKSWDTSSDGKTITFHLYPGGKWSDGKPLTSADVAWTANTIIKYQSGPTAVLASAVQHVKSVDAPDPNTAVFHYSAPTGNAMALAGGPLHPAPAHLAAVRHQQRQGAEDVPAREQPAAGVGRAVHDHPVPEEGHHGVQAELRLVRAQAAHRCVRAGLLHERRLDDRRPPVGPDLGGRPGAVHGGRTRSRRCPPSTSTPIPAVRSSTSPGTRTRTSRRTASCSIPRSRRRCRCASTSARSSRSCSTATRSPRAACSARSAATGAAPT